VSDSRNLLRSFVRSIPHPVARDCVNLRTFGAGARLIVTELEEVDPATTIRTKTRSRSICDHPAVGSTFDRY